MLDIIFDCSRYVYVLIQKILIIQQWLICKENTIIKSGFYYLLDYEMLEEILRAWKRPVLIN